MEDFAVTCRLVPDVPHLVSGSCSSPRAFGLGFLQTPPRGGALALLLSFGSAYTWREDFHLARSVPCLAHTILDSSLSLRMTEVAFYDFLRVRQVCRRIDPVIATTSLFPAHPHIVTEKPLAGSV